MSDYSILDITTPVAGYIRRIGELDDDVVVAGGSNIAEDLGIDSLARIDLVVLIEKHFDVVFDEAEMVEVTTVQELFDVIQRALAGR
ncbi:phosphopantetheine-binding protein [Mesorhizobium sp. MSK_1335]|uniref:Phosphopantetheine-binding protein n=1 Tax=Mesorhizobium montanum TaxID=3072323 RepID=A0ABU4ZLJ5_9HYPH|nr:phosphopantetheine-binding protein [Mesorhizobium sp. MSK_1335]MDX8525907.1 phosphopantetheine-binding protein [Mesorhizobium sp. MSK_1335]